MYVRMLFNNEHLINFNKDEMNLISTALTRHCLDQFKFKRADDLELQINDTLEVGIIKYVFHCIMSICTIFEVWNNSDTAQKKHIDSATARLTKSFLQLYFDANKRQFEEDFRKVLRQSSVELRFEFATDDSETIPEYKFIAPPVIIQHVLDQLQFVQIDEAVKTRMKSMPNNHSQKLQKSENEKIVQNLIKKLQFSINKMFEQQEKLKTTLKHNN